MISIRNAVLVGLVSLAVVTAFPVLAASNAAAQTGFPQQPADALIDQAQHALASGETDHAESLLLRARQIDPRNAQAQFGLAMVDEVRHRWPDALKQLDLAQHLDPTLSDIFLQRGLIYCNLHQFDAALPQLQRFVKLRPDSQQGRYLAGLASFFTDHFQSAVKYLLPIWHEQAATRPANLEYFYVLATAAEQVGEDKLSQKALNELMQLGGDSTLLHLLAGRAYLNSDAPALALPHLQKVAATEPNTPLINFTLGLAYQGLKRYPEARAAFRRDLELQPAFALDYERLGEIDNELHDSEQAVKDYQQALERDPNLAVAMYGMAVAQYRLNQPQPALDLLRRAVALVPNAAEVHYLMGRILQQMGRTAESKTEFSLSAHYQQKSTKTLQEKFDREVRRRIRRN